VVFSTKTEIKYDDRLGIKLSLQMKLVNMLKFTMKIPFYFAYGFDGKYFTLLGFDVFIYKKILKNIMRAFRRYFATACSTAKRYQLKSEPLL
jgi:hypothetical protein